MPTIKFPSFFTAVSEGISRFINLGFLIEYGNHNCSLGFSFCDRVLFIFIFVIAWMIALPVPALRRKRLHMGHGLGSSRAWPRGDGWLALGSAQPCSKPMIIAKATEKWHRAGNAHSMPLTTMRNEAPHHERPSSRGKRPQARLYEPKPVVKA